VRSAPAFRFIDLFAGIGGFRFALDALGGECVLTVERDRFARQTYAAWHEIEDESTFLEDIEDVEPELVPDHDILAAGFPCQPFSLAGVSKKNSLGRAHGLDDPTQGHLFFRIARIAAEKRPRMLLLENVKNLRSHDGGETWRTIRQHLLDINYTPHIEVYDARHWVAQHRERVFILAFNDDLVDPETPFEFPTPPKRPKSRQRTLKGVLQSGHVDDRYVLTDNLWKYLRAYRDKHAKKGNGFGYSVFGPADVARTLSARYHKDGSEILIARPDDPEGVPRRLTPIEAQRLMGFDSRSLGRAGRSPRIVVSDTQAYRQFGNAVVPAVAKFVAAAGWAHATGPGARQARVRRVNPMVVRAA
jgi:DNA (cytosine-5)-methyltransferase 1